ncbi:hypothetical protein BYT27DRAFT_7247961 [Phlegmacium glaucopus]|nr:hypothetical protein BYT27DRAFT_7247961 [Phlegmacium glaucopus]
MYTTQQHVQHTPTTSVSPTNSSDMYNIQQQQQEGAYPPNGNQYQEQQYHRQLCP